MKIMVFDVPAENGGALTILNQYYQDAINHKDTEWIFIVSVPELKETDNIKVLKFPWIKKSWFHRLYFDKFIASKLVKEYDVDEVLSLQNIIIPNIKVKQTLYMHQSLPFAEKRFKITENFKFWIYQNIIGRMICNSIVKADEVIVQTNWVKNAILEKVDVNGNKFTIESPQLTINIKKTYSSNNSEMKIFFYPANGSIYKNHGLIVNACLELKKQNIDNYKVIFTLKGDENKHVNNLYNIVNKNNLPIKFIGMIDIEEVYDFYSKSTLIFPSYIETFGLPLLEAKEHNTPILASDCAFSHEILDEYENVDFFDPFDLKEIYMKMREYCE